MTTFTRLERGRIRRRGHRRAWMAPCLAFAATAGLALGSAAAQDRILKGLTADDVAVEANSAVALVGFVTYPDITTSSLSIDSNIGGDKALLIGQLGDGFTVSESVPLYLEGVLGYARYDPTFVVSDGGEERDLPLKWTTFAATGGVGWDFKIADEWVLRPIANLTLAHIETDLSVAGRVIDSATGRAIEFLQNGRANVYGLGGSLMLDYEHYREDYEVDVELRYSHMYLESFDGEYGIHGSATTQTLGLWSRYREPTGIEVLRRPLRWVLEFAYSEFIGDQGDALGVDRLGSLGAGLEIDLSDVNNIITRTRLLARYQIGDNISGYSIGLGISF